MKALVMGYHAMGCIGLEALLRHGFEVNAVYTHRNDPREEVWWSSLAEKAVGYGIPVSFPEDIRDPKWTADVEALAPDFIFSFYYRHMIPSSILTIPPRGALNLHGSLLPRYRGRAPVNWVLVNGEAETGISLHYMEVRPDAGNLVDQERVEIAFSDTARTLFAKLEAAAEVLLDRCLPLLLAGTAPSVPQDLSKGTYFGGRRPEDGRVDWGWPAARIYNLIRAVTHPYPGAFTTVEGRKLFLWWGLPETGAPGASPGTVLEAGAGGVVIAAGEGSVRLLSVQREGEPELPASALSARGVLVQGMRLGN